MGYNCKLMLCICSVALILARVSSATSGRDIRGFIDKHNKARAAVGVCPIKCNEAIARYAQTYADVRSRDCAMEHSMGPYGENIASGEGMTGAAAVKYWVTEKDKSTYVGCATSLCTNGQTFIVCDYDPFEIDGEHSC
ncbi:basic form of pathogenesis-related protein 1-like [Pyrus ussuriensis x Pyrus communis]|uniref:Basic form of pathogenesis-related protein 1-like n=1 Tax=Pyrus ussuriensis x Pyrus communis TaxID=2448454 RepID=A0A5N5HNP8_9ROSA|nr:basic form of pathogenesis-related protein 1-like [Pyrus ussuriensis x Pyrus communis]